MEKMKDGDMFEPGCVIYKKSFLGKTKLVITRVTAKYAVAKITDAYEEKYERLYKSFGFQSVPKTPYSKIEYSAYKPDQNTFTNL